MINITYCCNESGFSTMAIPIFHLYTMNEKTFYIDEQMEIQSRYNKVSQFFELLFGYMPKKSLTDPSSTMSF